MGKRRYDVLSIHTVRGVTFQRAYEMASPRPPLNEDVRKLAKSLHCYCSPDDIDLDRASFLRAVSSRIADDLASGDY